MEDKKYITKIVVKDETSETGFKTFERHDDYSWNNYSAEALNVSIRLGERFFDFNHDKGRSLVKISDVVTIETLKNEKYVEPESIEKEGVLLVD